MEQEIKQGMEKRIAEIKNGNKWEASTTDPITGKEVYRCLSADLSAQYLSKSSYIKSVKRTQRYTHQEITVTYVSGVRARYILPAYFG